MSDDGRATSRPAGLQRLSELFVQTGRTSAAELNWMGSESSASGREIEELAYGPGHEWPDAETSAVTAGSGRLED